MSDAISVSAPISGTDRTLTFESGKLAQLADGAVLGRIGDTVLLATATASRSVREGADFFPLTVDIEERAYASGKIPGSFFRREGKSSDQAILTCRLIDRPLRPSFPKGFRNEVHVVGTIFGADQINPHDVLAINAASAALMLSGIPFDGPIGAVRVAYSTDGVWIPHPTFEEGNASTFELVVAGRALSDADDADIAIMMVEAEATAQTYNLVRDGATAPTEDVVAQGLEASKKFIKALCDAQSELAKVAAKPTAEFPVFLEYQDDVYEAVSAAVSTELTAALTIVSKQQREAETDRVKALAVAAVGPRFEGREKEISGAFRSLTKKLVRQRVLRDKVRIDGRGLTDIRALSAEVNVLPRVHGSALFERGETQILGVTTLNMLRMEQMLDTLAPETRKRYMHNYNFPPYSTGETGRVGSPKRREIGHGALAERALVPVLPTREEFPYAIRQVSEALGSNGSTSMGSVCASTMALLSAGVPLRAPVAGIAMGLISDTVDGKTGYVTLTDILGAEDAFGDMDFKVAGTEDGITALQMDIKIEGVSAEILQKALGQAREGRLHILGIMNQTIAQPRTDISDFAPKVISVKVPTEKIGLIIGPGGKNIKGMSEKTGSTINIDDTGMVTIYNHLKEGAERAQRMVEGLIEEAVVGKTYTGPVKRIMDFGAFVEILPGKEGLVHISKLAAQRVENVSDVVHEGQELTVTVTEIDHMGRINLATKEAIEANPALLTEHTERRPPRRDGDRPRSGGYDRPRGGSDRPHTPRRD